MTSADPGHPQAAILHGDAAGLLEQGLPVGDPNDGFVDPAQHPVEPAEVCRLLFGLQPLCDFVL